MDEVFRRSGRLTSSDAHDAERATGAIHWQQDPGGVPLAAPTGKDDDRRAPAMSSDHPFLDALPT